MFYISRFSHRFLIAFLNRMWYTYITTIKKQLRRHHYERAYPIDGQFADAC